jgi:hypothetical protein
MSLCNTARHLGAPLNWRPVRGIELEIEQSKQRTKQIESDILRVRSDSEQIEREAELIRSETEQL